MTCGTNDIIIKQSLFSQFKTAMTNVVIAHHLSIVAELEKSTAVKTRKEAFKAIDEAIAIFQKVEQLL